MTLARLAIKAIRAVANCGALYSIDPGARCLPEGCILRPASLGAPVAAPFFGEPRELNTSHMPPAGTPSVPHKPRAQARVCPRALHPMAVPRHHRALKIAVP